PFAAGGVFREGRRTRRRRLDGRPRSADLDVFHDRVRAARLETVGGVDRGADAPREERIARRQTLDLLEGVDGKSPRTIEPLLVARASERLQERVAVARR